MLAVRDLRVTFPRTGGDFAAVDGVGFDVAPGEFFVVIGESGSGKSMTGSAIMGLTPPSARVAGSIRLHGRELAGLPDVAMRPIRGREIGLVHQDPLSAMNPARPVGAQIAEALQIHRLADRQEAARRAVALLARVHVPDASRVAQAYPHEISGGMRQRAMIAMALACQPGLLIADEPTTALDVTIKAQVLALLAELRQEMGLAVLLITHDMGVVAELADRILVMYAGRVAEIGSAESVLRAPRHPYTRALMQSAAISELPFKQLLPAIAGTPPGHATRPSGCAFHPRCPRAEADCAVVVPPLQPSPAGALACHPPRARAAVPA